MTQRPHRSRPAPRPEPLLRHRHRLHLRRPLLLVRPRPRAHHAHRQGLAPGGQLPRREPRLQVRRAVQRRRGGRARRLQRPDLHLQPDHARLRLRHRLHALQLQRRHPRRRRVPRRHRPRERPAHRSTSACATTTRRPTRPSSDQLDENGNPTGDHLPADRLLHLEHDLAAARLQLEADRRRQDRAQGPLGPLLTARSRPASTRTRSAPASRRSSSGPYDIPSGTLRRTSRCRGPTRTWASTRTTRARTRTSSS